MHRQRLSLIARQSSRRRLLGPPRKLSKLSGTLRGVDAEVEEGGGHVDGRRREKEGLVGFGAGGEEVEDQAEHRREDKGRLRAIAGSLAQPSA